MSTDVDLRPDGPSKGPATFARRSALAVVVSMLGGCPAQPEPPAPREDTKPGAATTDARETASADAAPPGTPPAKEPTPGKTGEATTTTREDPTPWPTCNPSGGSSDALDRPACLTAAEVRTHLEFVAKERVPGSAHWQAVQDRCAETFTKNGFTVERMPFTADDGGAELRGVNVIGTKRGRVRPEETVVVGAHYEHIPGCAGADDNGSGTAALLALAEELAGVEPDRTLVLACWDQEETGLHGSRVHADAIEKSADKVVLALVFDTMGVRRREPGSQQLPPGLDVVFADAAKQVAARESRGDFVAVLGNPPANTAASRFVVLSPRGGVDAIALVLPAMLVGSDLAADLHRSDHANFWIRGWPALMLTDTANFRTPTYHCLGAPDDVNTVDVEFITGIAQASLALVVETTKVR